MASPRKGTVARTREKRMLLTQDEEVEVEDLLHDMRRALGFRVNFSELCRAAVTHVLMHQEKFLAQLEKSGKGMRRPQTVDLQGNFDFEFELAELLTTAVRRRK